MTMHRGGPNIIVLFVLHLMRYSAHVKMVVHYSSIAKNYGFSSTDVGAFCYI